MKEYKQYAESIHKLNESLFDKSGMALSYIKGKADGVDRYTNYISNKFFGKKDKNSKIKTISKYDIEESISIIESAINEYTELKEEIEQDETITPALQVFLLRKIEESQKSAEIAKKATLFEAEKAGYDIIFEGTTFEIKKNEEKIAIIAGDQDIEAKKEKYLEEMNSLQTEIYGERISDNDEERSLVISICNNKYKKNKERLTHEEQIYFEAFLNRFETDIKKVPSEKKVKTPTRGNLKMDKIMQGAELIKNTFYPNINWDQKIVKGKTGYAAEFSTKTREYPDKEEDLFNKLLTAIGHEDGTHMIRGYNQEQNGLIIAGAAYSDIEEGITKLNETLLQHILDDYPLVPNDNFISVFIGENYNFEDTYKLINILKKLNNSKGISPEKEASIAKQAFNRAQRVKAYYPRDQAGANRKEVIYFRGEKKLISYLKSLPNDEERARFYKKAMQAKVSFDDIFSIDTIIEELGGNTENLYENKLVDKVFNTKLKEGSGAFSKTTNQDGTTNIEQNLLKGDFRFNGMEEYKTHEKKAIIELFDMVGYKKYRGKYTQEQKWNELKTKDQLRKGNIISYKSNNEWKKGKVIKSSLDDLEVALQNDGKYSGGKTETILKKDVDSLEDLRVLNKIKKTK